MLKKPTTYEIQLNILKSRNIIIEDEDFCLRTLSNLNYYRLTAYMLPYKLSGELYEHVTFEKIYHTYEFDRKLRSLLLTVLEEIELSLRTKLAYFHAHKYGEIGYLTEGNYNNKHKHSNFLTEFNKIIEKNKDNPFVLHHLVKYSGNFPIWVAVELFPLGMLSRFYADMTTADRRAISKNDYGIGYKQLESWLVCLTTLRNRCAHYMRLYFYRFNKWPSEPHKVKIPLSNTIFDYIYIMKYTYLDDNKWQNSFLADLGGLIEQYQEHIELGHIGFHKNWRALLAKN